MRSVCVKRRRENPPSKRSCFIRKCSSLSFMSNYRSRWRQRRKKSSDNYKKMFPC